MILPAARTRRPRGHSSLWAALLLCALGACDPFHTGFDALEPASVYAARAPGAPTMPGATLRVMTWNIKFGGGRIDFFFDCHGGRVLMDRGEVLANLDGLADTIRRLQPDLLLLQEVDVNSKRSAHVDQLQYLLDHTHLDHAVYASAWKADFIPSDGLGPMDSGNAILSRWPLRDAERIGLPLRSDQDALTRYFYLRPNMLRARLALPTGQEVRVLAVHTTAYGTGGAKRTQIGLFQAELERLVAGGDLLVAGGDLNTIPPGSIQTSGYPDSVCVDEAFIADDYAADAGILDGLYATFSSAIPLATYAADNGAHATHTTDGRGFWNRKLDYLFTSGTLEPGSGTSHQDATTGVETMPLSDHAPVSAAVRLP